MQARQVCTPPDDFLPTPLRAHQARVVQFLTHSSKKGLWIIHSTGTGKTVTALAAATCLAATRAYERIVLLTPKSVLPQWQQHMVAFGLTDLHPPIELDTHDRWLRRFEKREVDAKRCILIVDEAHKFRSRIYYSVKKRRWQGVRSLQLLQAASDASKVLLLTATPMVNGVADLRNGMAILKGHTDFRVAYKEFKSAQPDLASYMRCDVSMHRRARQQHDPDFPNVRIHTKTFRMAPSYYRDYLGVQTEHKDTLRLLQSDQVVTVSRSLKAFLNGIRRAVNALTLDRMSTKTLWLCKQIPIWVRDKEPCVVYSGWRNAGLRLVQACLEREGVPSEKIDGTTSASKRAALVRDYNQGKIGCLMISSAGSEGLDLKATRHLVILEPHWNQMRIEQTIGRAVRYRSHANLPAEQQTVHVWQLRMVKPARPDPTDDMLSADELLARLSQVKHAKITTEWEHALMQASIEAQETSCP